MKGININRKTINRKKYIKKSRKIKLLVGGDPLNNRTTTNSGEKNIKSTITEKEKTNTVEETPEVEEDMNQHLKDITPDNLKNANTEMIGEQVSKFGNNITQFASQSINAYIIQFNDIVEKYIRPLDIKLFGSGVHIIMLKSNVLLKEIRPELEVIFKELIELYSNLLEDSNPLLKKLISSFLDNITSVFTVFITKVFGIMSMIIQDIIKSIPIAGEIFDILQLFSRSSLCFFQILYQVLHTYRDLIGIISQIISGTKENIENWRKIKNSFFSILFKIGNTFRNIVPDISKQAQKMIDSVPNISKSVEKLKDSVPNISKSVEKLKDSVPNISKSVEKLKDIVPNTS